MNILCFGDSNTWGLRPMIGDRYKREERWTGILENMSNGGFHVIEEGLNGRTACDVEVDEPHLNSRGYIEACLLSHRPVDVLVVMLGSNDVKVRYGLSAEKLAESIGVLVKDMKKILDERQSERVKILLVSPKSIDERILGDGTFDEKSIADSRKLGKLLENIARKELWYFVDADEEGVTVGEDGLHLSEDGHQVLGKSVYTILSAGR